jgi:hypothetical protein
MQLTVFSSSLILCPNLPLHIIQKFLLFFIFPSALGLPFFGHVHMYTHVRLNSA